MLKSLNIENIAVIEKCNIEFSEGFNVLTGETGAGKSIIIDAINAVTGQRTSKELIRTGSDRAVVTALFDWDDNVSSELSLLGIEKDEDETLFVQRIITADGKNICKINGVSVNVSALKTCISPLVDIHGQHDNQTLSDPKRHLSVIDEYAGNSAIFDQYTAVYKELRRVMREIKAADIDENEKEKRIELLKFQIDEIEKAKITAGELDELIKRRDVIRNSEKLSETLKMCLSYLNGDEDNSGAVSLCFDAVKPLSQCENLLPEIKKTLENLRAASDELYEIAADVENKLSSVSFDPDELDITEQRIALINDLKKKYGGSEENILKYLCDAEAELNGMNASDERLSELIDLSDGLKTELIKVGEKLTKSRKDASLKLSKQICDILSYLEMPNVRFSAGFSESQYTASGHDDVEFLISANAGESEKPLEKIASGGELSRIMLAIKSILASENDASTLIFDEIDTGISGVAADKVGRQMKKLSKNKQVLAVTHLAQIAAAADEHLLITKSVKNGNTYTAVESISGESRIKEIARIMSGGEMTESLKRSAVEMLESHKN